MIEPVLRQCIASDGYPLHYRQWTAADPKGIVIALHGIQSHSGWYGYSSGRLAEAGYTVCFLDRRGSGLNGRERGHAAHGERLINDARSLAQQIRHDHEVRRFSPVPITLLGLSWGAKIAAATAALFPDEFDQLVLLYPGLESRIRPNPWQRFQLNLARHFEIVRRHIPIPLSDPAMFTSRAEWQAFISADPLALHAVTSSLLNAGRDLDIILQRESSRIVHPLLLMLAGRDEVIDNQKVLARIAAFGSRYVTIRTYPDARHTLEFEAVRETFVSHLIAWLDGLQPV
ncbi:MAG: alpha/beta fold hydrolase [Planctomycetota bacterium]